MGLFLSFFTFLFGLLPGLLFSNYSAVQSKADDTLAKSEINSLYQNLEVHYNEYGYYPTIKDVEQNYDLVMPGIDPEVLYDANERFINEGNYTYEPVNCNALGCQKYTLSAELQDGTTYTKQSLN